MNHLFDPDPYTQGAPRKPRARRKQAALEGVRLGRDGWRLVVVKGEPRAHVVLEGEAAQRARRELEKAGYAVVTLCRRGGTALTFDDGTLAPACPECVKRGARVAA